MPMNRAKNHAKSAIEYLFDHVCTNYDAEWAGIKRDNYQKRYKELYKTTRQSTHDWNQARTKPWLT